MPGRLIRLAGLLATGIAGGRAAGDAKQIELRPLKIAGGGHVNLPAGDAGEGHQFRVLDAGDHIEKGAGYEQEPGAPLEASSKRSRARPKEEIAGLDPKGLAAIEPKAAADTDPRAAPDYPRPSRRTARSCSCCPSTPGKAVEPGTPVVTRAGTWLSLIHHSKNSALIQKQLGGAQAQSALEQLSPGSCVGKASRTITGRGPASVPAARGGGSGWGLPAANGKGRQCVGGNVLGQGEARHCRQGKNGREQFLRHRPLL